MRKATYLDRQFQYWLLISLSALLLCIVNISGIIAKEKPRATARQAKILQDDKSKKPGEKSISDDDVKLWLKQIEIYGQIAKPQTVFIIPGTDPRVDGLRIDRHFFSHIFRPVEKSTLRRVRMKQGKGKDHILW